MVTMEPEISICHATKTMVQVIWLGLVKLIITDSTVTIGFITLPSHNKGIVHLIPWMKLIVQPVSKACLSPGGHVMQVNLPVMLHILIFVWKPLPCMAHMTHMLSSCAALSLPKQ